MKIKNIMFDLGGVIMTIDQPSAVKRFKEIGLEDADRRLDPYTQSGIFGDLEEGKISGLEKCEMKWEQAWAGIRCYLCFN